MEHPWLNREEYPFQPRYYNINGQRLHYIDEGQGPVILFVHGTPSWSFDWRNVIKQLTTHYRCIAVDHIGFGLSDKPEHYNYSPQQHSQTLEELIGHLQLSSFALVVHDFGGPIGLNVALRHPEKINRLAILNTWLWNCEADPAYQKMKPILRSPLLPLLYRWFNFSARFILPRAFGSKPLPAHLLSQYTAPFANKKQRNGTVAFAQSLLTHQAWFGQLWQQVHRIAHKPTLLLWGLKDPAIPETYLQRFAGAFTQATVVKLPNCGHFPQEEEPEKVASAIQQLMQQ